LIFIASIVTRELLAFLRRKNMHQINELWEFNMYYLSPRNRYILVEEKQQEVEEERSFVLPAGYKQDILYHKIMRVIEDSSGNYEPESLILVPTNVLEEVDIDGQKHYLVGENYVIAVVTQLENKI
jgi:hypothetical protein